MRRLLIVFATSTLLLAGCGGGGGAGKPSGAPLTKDQYQAKLKQISKDLTAGLRSTTSTTGIEKGDVDKLVTALHSFSDQLAQINPPAEIKDLHSRLTGAISDLADEFPGIAATLNSTKDPSAAFAALFGSKGIQELTKLGAEFKAKGYDLNLNG